MTASRLENAVPVVRGLIVEGIERADRSRHAGPSSSKRGRHAPSVDDALRPATRAGVEAGHLAHRLLECDEPFLKGGDEAGAVSHRVDPGQLRALIDQAGHAEPQGK